MEQTLSTVLGQLIGTYRGKVVINDTEYPALDTKALAAHTGQVTIILNPTTKKSINDDVASVTTESVVETNSEPIYRIKVRQYMTKPPSAGFDFHDKWNKGIPMPMRIMVGKVLRETKGMVQMELWGEIIGEQNHVCMKCGKALTNPVSKYFGIGPECGGHNYVNPFETDEELRGAVQEMNEQLKQTTWTGWVIKSAIEEKEEVR